MSIDGYRYAMMFTDDFSSCLFVYFLKQKSDAATARAQFLADMRSQGNIEAIWSDNGGEFMSKAFERILRDHTIRHEFSAP